MADKSAARRARASHVAIDVETVRASVRSRLKGRTFAANASTVQHVDAIGRGERSASPAKGKVGSAG
jgi:hypothetical protein